MCFRVWLFHIACESWVSFVCVTQFVITVSWTAVLTAYLLPASHTNTHKSATAVPFPTSIIRNFFVTTSKSCFDMEHVGQQTMLFCKLTNLFLEIKGKKSYI